MGRNDELITRITNLLRKAEQDFENFEFDPYAALMDDESKEQQLYGAFVQLEVSLQDALDVFDEQTKRILYGRYSKIASSTEPRYMANMVSADSGMNNPLSRYMGARLMTQWTAMLNVIGAEESPDFEEYDQYFDGTLPECLNKLREYQRLIDDNGVDAYISLEAMRGGNYFEGTISQICEDLLNHDYITEEEYYDYTDGFYR